VNSTTRQDVPQIQIRNTQHAYAHAVHGLVAIAKGPDYCLCGNLWPCRPSEESAG
jgi:hypothetical protein